MELFTVRVLRYARGQSGAGCGHQVCIELFNSQEAFEKYIDHLPYAEKKTRDIKNIDFIIRGGIHV